MTGGLARDVSQLLDAGLLVLAFAVLGLRGPRFPPGALAAQGVLLAAVAAWQGWSRGDWVLAAAAAPVLAGCAVAVPAALRRLAAEDAPATGARPVASPAASLAAGLALATAAALLLPAGAELGGAAPWSAEPGSPGPGSPEPWNIGPANVGSANVGPAGAVPGATTRESLVVATAVLLLGMLAATVRPDAPGRASGLCCAGRGALLLAFAVPAMPMPALLAVGTVALEAALVAVLLPALPRGPAPGGPPFFARLRGLLARAWRP